MAIQVANDSPCWLKPRRTVYWLVDDSKPAHEQEVTKSNGARLWFKTYEAAAAAALRRNTDYGGEYA